MPVRDAIRKDGQVFCPWCEEPWPGQREAPTYRYGVGEDHFWFDYVCPCSPKSKKNRVRHYMPKKMQIKGGLMDGS